MFNWFRPRRTDPPAPEPVAETRALDFADMPWLAALPSSAGIIVSPQTVWRSPTAAACVRLLSEVVGGLPFKVHDRAADKEPATSHPAYRLVHDRANGWTSAQALRSTLMVDALTHGEGAALVVRVRSRPVELHRLVPGSWRCELDRDTGEPRYIITDSAGGQRTHAWRDVVHIAAPGSSPDRPVRVLDSARSPVALDIAMAGWQGRVFESGARPSGTLTVPRNTSPETLERIKAIWAAAHSGDKAGPTAILEDGMTWQALALNMVDADVLNLRRLGIEEIARAFKVPPVFVGDYSRATWRNLEEATRQFLMFSVLPWLEVWQFEYEKVLLNDRERDSYFVEAVTDDLMRGDTLSLYNALRVATGGAILTANEARALVNRGPLPDADALLLQAGQSAAGDAAPTPAASNDENNT